MNMQIDQLEALFDRCSAREELEALYRELVIRNEKRSTKRPRVVRLLQRAQDKLGFWKEIKAEPSSSSAEVSSVGAVPKPSTGMSIGGEIIVPISGAASESTSEAELEIDDPDVDDAALETPHVSVRSASLGAKQPMLFGDEAIPQLETPRVRAKGQIRPVGRAPGAPEKWAPLPKTGFRPSWSSDDPIVRRYEAALRALIAEIRRRDRGGQQIILSDGRKVGVDGEENAYRFPWNGEEDLFEGAKLAAVADGFRTSGRLLSIQAEALIMSFEAELGPIIGQCVVTIDNTAMLEALADRLKEIAEGKSAGFNLALAEDAVTNGAIEAPAADVPPQHFTVGSDRSLNERQREAVRRAAGNSVFYLWGPPGTGKTETLTGLVRHQFSTSKRSLIASNTNQAVDQVLAKLCENLVKSGGRDWSQVPELAEGKIIRIGRIADDGKLKAYEEAVSVDRIVERKSAELVHRRAELEQLEADILRAAEGAHEIVALFAAAAAAVTRLRASEQAHERAKTELAHHHRMLNELTRKKRELEEELDRSRGAGILARLVRRKPDEVLSELNRLIDEMRSELDKLPQVERSVIAAGEMVEADRAVAERARDAIAGLDEAAARAVIEQAEGKLRPIRKEIAEINRQLADMKNVVLAEALVIGATATKLFLSPTSFTRLDTVILDEASMLLLPALFHAVGMAKERVVISGDFRQLPPIVQSEEAAILDEIGADVFTVAKVKDAFVDGRGPQKRMVMLEEQRRMAQPICELISEPMYDGKLRTVARQSPAKSPPEPFDRHMTIIDTSWVGPFTAKDPTGSKFNLMNALIVRNLCRYLRSEGFGSKEDIGIVVPYAAQRKLLQQILLDIGMDLTTGTVHRYQGDEKTMMVIDLTDGIGLRSAGPWFQADHADDPGSRLFNVAISRAKDHIVFVGDLSWLDKRLPGRAFLRNWLYRIQEEGRVVDVRDVLGLVPIAEDLAKYGTPFTPSAESEEAGLFNEVDFDQAVLLDLKSAKQGIAIWSAFVTPKRVSKYAELFRAKVAEGVPVRCVVRPPWDNGTIDEGLGEEALSILEATGCIVDTRYRMHEKAVLIDDRILWYGSLNALSSAGNTGEMMARVEGKKAALQMAAFLSAKGFLKPKQAEGVSYQRENINCGCGKTRAVLGRSKFGLTGAVSRVIANGPAMHARNLNPAHVRMMHPRRMRSAPFVAAPCSPGGIGTETISLGAALGGELGARASSRFSAQSLRNGPNDLGRDVA